jgi:hypothetical protein
VTNVTEMINTYSFAVRRNLLIPYCLCRTVAIPILLLGATSMHRNGVSAMGGGFLQTVMTTTGSRSLNEAAARGCLGGMENVSQELMDLKIQFGELVGIGDGSEVKRAGLGTEDEVIPLNKITVYET